MGLGQESVEWIAETTRWWLESFGGYPALAKTPLVLPIEEHFPVDTTLEGHALAEDYFAFVVEHAGMTEWPLMLEPVEQPNVADALQGMPHAMTAPPVGGEPAPVLSEDEPLFVPYEAQELDDPVRLVASMARGASHYLLHDGLPEPPWDEEQWPQVVDLGAVLMGFGVFLANGAFRFEQHGDGMLVGWGYSHLGALSEEALSYSLALFCTLTDAPRGEVLTHLRTNPEGYFKAALKDLRRKRRALLDRLRRIEPPPAGPYR